MKTLHHPELNQTIVRNARQAKVLAGSGWVDVTEDVEPPRNATTEAWRKHLEDHDVFAPGDASRADLISLWDNRAH